METDSSPRRWITDAVLPSYLLQLVISTLGAMTIGFVVCLLPALFFAAVTKSTSGGNFMDSVVAQPFLLAAGEPYFAAPILTSFALGAFAPHFFRSRSGAWVWVLPTLFLILVILSERRYHSDIWANFFGKGCGSSECLGEFFATAPFYTSVAYALGWTAGGAIRRSHVRRTYP